MKEIEITEENVQIYQEYLSIKNRIISSDYSELLVSLKLFSFIIATLGVLISFSIITMFTTIIETLISVGISLGALTGIVYLEKNIFCELPIRLEMKKFKKNNPNFDTNINLEELEKELNKYYTLSELPKDLKKQKEEHFSLYKKNEKEMTLEEQLIALEKEKIFLMQLNEKKELEQVNFQKKLKK